MMMYQDEKLFANLRYLLYLKPAIACVLIETLVQKRVLAFSQKLMIIEVLHLSLLSARSSLHGIIAKVVYKGSMYHRSRTLITLVRFSWLQMNWVHQRCMMVFGLMFFEWKWIQSIEFSQLKTNMYMQLVALDSDVLIFWNRALFERCWLLRK